MMLIQTSNPLKRQHSGNLENEPVNKKTKEDPIEIKIDDLQPASKIATSLKRQNSGKLAEEPFLKKFKVETICDLPDEIKNQILFQCGVEAILNFMAINNECKTFICNNDILWNAVNGSCQSIELNKKEFELFKEYIKDIYAHFKNDIQKEIDTFITDCKSINSFRLQTLINYINFLHIWNSLLPAKSEKIHVEEFNSLKKLAEKVDAFPKWYQSNEKKFLNFPYLHQTDKHIQLTTIPKEIKFLTFLENIDFNDNLLKKIPKEICLLSNLKILSIENNKLVSLPNEIGQLKNLKELYLSNNDLMELPGSICLLPKLAVLKLSNNKLTRLPEGFEQLKKLKFLDIRGCSLTNIDVLQKMPNLKEVVMD
jgi:Leucine rich repeat